jgi:phage FluMu protein gp41
MAKNFLVNLDLNKNELQNAKVQNLGTAPGSPASGQIYYDTGDNELYVYNGSAWVSLQAVGDITGVTAGTGLSGGGSSGSVTVNFAPTGLSSATVASNDKVIIADVDDSDTPKTVTAASIAALAPQGDITSVVAGTNLSGGGTSGDVTLNLDTNISLASVTLSAASPLVFEGATADAHETTFAITDPTADRTITFQNATGTVAHLDSDITGNAATATALATAREINGTSFDGTANITVTAAAGTLTGNTLKSSVTASSLTSVGTLTSLTVGGALTVGSDGSGYDVTFHSATSGDSFVWDSSEEKLTITGTNGQTALDVADGDVNIADNVVIGGTATFNAASPLVFEGATADAHETTFAITDPTGDRTITFQNATGTVAHLDSDITGNAATATALATARAINGTNFDGTAAITVTAAANTLTTNTLASGVTASSLTSVGTLSSLTVGGAVTVGSDGSGYDVTFHSATSGDSFLWDASDEKLVITGTNGANALEVADGDVNISDNLTIGGNFTVNGTTTTVNTETLSVEDPLIKLANGNSSADSVDIGFYGLYDTSGSQDLYSGLFRDASDSGKYKLFKDLQAEPTTTVNTGGTGYAAATLVVGTLEGAVTGDVTGNADTATTATNVTASANNSGNETVYLTFVDGATGAQGIETDTGLNYNPSTGMLTTTGVTAALTGNASTATALATARNIGGVSFDGTGNIDLPGVNSSGNQDTSGNAATATALATARNIGGVSFDGTANINLPGVNTAGDQDTSGTAAIATSVTVSANNSTDETVYPLFVDGATGTQGAETDTGLSYNPSTGVLTTTSVTGNLTGTVLTASQTNITAIGTIATGTWEATDIAVAHGGTGASTAAAARTNLGATTKVTGTIGDNSATAIAVTHNLGTNDVMCEVYDASSLETVECEVDRTSTNAVTFTFASAPGTNAYKVVIIG